MSFTKYPKLIFFFAAVLVLVGVSSFYAWAVQPQAGQGNGAIGVDTNTNNVSFGTSTALSSSIVAIRASSSVSDSLVILNTAGNTVLRFSGDDMSVGGAGIDTNYSISTANGGIKAENNNASQPSGYFNNIAGGTALLTGNGNVGIGRSPSYKLDVNGTTNATQYCIAGANCISAWPSSGGQWTTSGTNIYNANTGNVGIGLTGPGYKLDVAGNVRASGEMISTSANAFRMVQGNYGVFWRNDGPTTYLLMTASGDPYGSWNSLRPIYFDNLTGNTYFGGTVTIGASGGGKLNVGTIDPIYDIGGVKYATYVAGMTGVKEETAGTIKLQCKANEDCSAIIALVDAAKGTDLWLFSKATGIARNMDNLSVYLTASFKGDVWYEKDGGSVKVFATPSKSGELEVSYRLTAPRFDASTWSNLADQKADGMKVSE